jgi:hypothetical protein
MTGEPESAWDLDWTFSPPKPKTFPAPSPPLPFMHLSFHFICGEEILIQIQYKSRARAMPCRRGGKNK